LAGQVLPVVHSGSIVANMGRRKRSTPQRFGDFAAAAVLCEFDVNISLYDTFRTDIMTQNRSSDERRHSVDRKRKSSPPEHALAIVKRARLQEQPFSEEQPSDDGDEPYNFCCTVKALLETDVASAIALCKARKCEPDVVAELLEFCGTDDEKPVASRQPLFEMLVDEYGDNHRDLFTIMQDVVDEQWVRDACAVALGAQSSVSNVFSFIGSTDCNQNLRSHCKSKMRSFT
jgi:hypothetical protein